MNIIFFSDDFPPESFGGAGIVAFNLAKALLKEGHIVSIITTTQDIERGGIVEYEGLKIYRLYTNFSVRWRAYLSLYNPQIIRKVREIIMQVKPDVVHFHNVHNYLSYKCLQLAKQSGAKVFLTAHDVMLFHYGKLIEHVSNIDLSCSSIFNYRISPWMQIKRYSKRYNPFRNIIIKYFLRSVDKIFAVSYALKDALNQNGIHNVEVIHNGIDVAEWKAEVGDVMKFKEDHFLQKKKIILFGGRLSEAKGGYHAVLVLKEVSKHSPNAVMLVMGNKNKYAEQILKTAKKLGIEEKIIFTGWISGKNLKSAYAASDIVLVPSIYLDPFPTIVLEAMASVKPVIATCFGGARELVVDGKTGYIVNPYDIQLTATRILNILQTSEQASLMGTLGYKLVEKEFSLVIQAKKLLSWYSN